MVCLYIGDICLCKCTAGIEQGSPHSSLLKHFQRERQKELPILCSLKQTEEREGFTLASGFWLQPQHNVLSLSGSLFDTHTRPGQWLDFNMVMIRDGGSVKGGRGKGGLIYCRELGEVQCKESQRQGPDLNGRR